MAKTTAPLLSFGASGSVAKSLVYSKWKGRPYVRRHVVPANPQTTAQTTTRDNFRNAGTIWKSAPALLIAPWDRFAVGQVLTGRNKFMGDFVRLTRGDVDLLNMIFSPGAKGGLPATSMVITPGSTQLSVAITEPALPTGWTIQAGVAAALLDQDPQTGGTWAVTAIEDLSTPFVCVLTGLTASVLYVVGAWLRWAKPDGSIAYGASIQGTGTPTA